MKRTYVKKLKDNIGKTVTLAGWVDVRRDHGKLIFLDIRDATGVVQTVVTPKQEEALGVAERLRAEWVVRVEGEVKKRPDTMINPNIETGDIEISISTITVLSDAAEMPFDKEEKLNLDTYLDHLPLTLRSPRARAIFVVQAEIIRAYRAFLDKAEFIEFQAPKLVGGDAEGGAAVFKVAYLNEKDAFLATSPQLYKQIMAGVFERVFTTGNVFRGEKHSTSRHLNEYTSLDAEIAFIDDYRDVMEILSNVMRAVTMHLSKTCAREFSILNAELPTIPDEIPSLKLREAQALITEKTGEDCRGEKDLAPEHERWLSDYARAEFGSDLIYITHFPLEKTAFYAYEDPNDPGYAKYFDLLFRGVELASGGQRVHHYDELMKRILAKGLDTENFSFYLEAFKYGMPPHGGWGMGLERLTQKFLRLDNVKEATLFPREENRIDTHLDR